MCEKLPAYWRGLLVIEGPSHITFVASDLGRTARFLREVFGAEEIYSSGSETFSLSKEKFFLVGGVWVAVMEGEPLQEKTYNHVAFKVPEEELEAYARRAHGAEVREGRGRVRGEGNSLYIYDHDNHLFELHTGTLEQRLGRYGGG